MPKQRNRTQRRRAPGSVPRDSHGAVVGKLIVMLSIVAAVILGVTIFFRVHEVQVSGNKIYSEEQIREVCGVESGDNLLLLNRTGIAGKIYANLPYVQDVSIGRLPPDTVAIEIKESEIIGKVKSDVGKDWYVNSDGRVIGQDTDGYDGQVITLDGFTLTAPAAGTKAAASEGMGEELTAALAVLKQMEGSGLIELTTRIDASEVFDIVIECGSQYEIRLGGSDDLEYKIRCVKEVLDHVGANETGVIDLTTGDNGEIHFIPWK